MCADMCADMRILHTVTHACSARTLQGLAACRCAHRTCDHVFAEEHINYKNTLIISNIAYDNIFKVLQHATANFKPVIVSARMRA